MNFDSVTGEIIVTSISSVGVGWRSPDGSTWGVAPKALSLHPSTQGDYYAIACDKRTPVEPYDAIAQELSVMTSKMVEDAFYNSNGNFFFNPDRDPEDPFTTDDWCSLMCALNDHPDHPHPVTEEIWYYWLEVLPPITMHCDIQLPGTGCDIRVSFITGEGIPLIAGYTLGDWYYLVGVKDSPITIPEKGMFTAEEIYYVREAFR